MKTICSFILTSGVLLAAAGPGKKDPSRDDLDKLQGTWLTVSLVSDGKTMVDPKSPPKDGPGVKLAYEGNKWLLKQGDKTLAWGTTKLDPTKTPKEIDVTHESGRTKGTTLLGIYELDGDTYKYCMAPAGKPRPTAFASKEGSGHSLIVSKRQKP